MFVACHLLNLPSDFLHRDRERVAVAGVVCSRVAVHAD
jgi:hypothetical protein